MTCPDALQLFLLRARDRLRSCALVDPRRMQRMSDRKSVGSDGGRAEILAQKPASGEPSEGFGRMVASLDRKRLGADFWGGGHLDPRRFR